MMPGIRLRNRKITKALFLLLAVITVFLTSCSPGQQGKKENPGKLSSGVAAGIDSIHSLQLKISDNATFTSVLDDLDKRDLQNINRAMTLFAGTSADTLSRDSMFITLNDYMISSIQGYYDTKVFGNQELNELFRTREDREEAQKLVQKLASHGINLYFREGEFYLEPDQNFIYAHLHGALSSSGDSYLKTKIMLANGFKDANNQPVSPSDSLALQIVTWEDFIRKHPAFLMMDEIQIQYMDVLTTYLSGTEQLPLFDSSTKMLNQVYQASYIRFIENYPGRESTKIVGKFYELLSSKGYKYDEELENFLSDISVSSPKNPQ
jgi:hypothetical protein